MGLVPRARRGRGGGRGQRLPLHLAGLVMMRAEKSKRFLLIFRRVLTSSSSSLTWIVRCSWSPTRFCDRETRQGSIRHPGLAAGKWRLHPPNPLVLSLFHLLPPAAPSEFQGSLLPFPTRTRPQELVQLQRTTKRSAPEGHHFPISEQLSPFPLWSTSASRFSWPSPGSSLQTPAGTKQEGLRQTTQVLSQCSQAGLPAGAAKEPPQPHETKQKQSRVRPTLQTAPNTELIHQLGQGRHSPGGRH